MKVQVSSGEAQPWWSFCTW